MKRSKFLQLILGLPVVASMLSFKDKPVNKPTYFTPEMLRRHNFGLFVINTKAGDDISVNIGYSATVAWKLCWHLGEGKKYGKTNVFTDGWFCPLTNTCEELCDYLNGLNKGGETFRVMTKEEVVLLITKRQQGFI